MALDYDGIELRWNCIAMMLDCGHWTEMIFQCDAIGMRRYEIIMILEREGFGLRRPWVAMLLDGDGTGKP